ncbi:MAG: 2-succinyl-5-enolpyruvyl-6-hydroxy-3-cyclohexene-1-carboxylic-acid synthase [Myxococcales bacterium]|nr:2-succinyl-5-enolpyruvyl-6-hydroxy-3-cyclohexene-1-carboxylic-acid synthase [Myxococcales bacterium]
MSAEANRQAAAAFVRGLLDGGVVAAVLSPGARSTPLAFALADAADRGELALEVELDERAAGFLALGRARAARAPVALACTSGSAGAHWLPAAIEAAESGVPLVLCTADRPAELLGVGAPQAIDQRRLFGAFAPFARDLPAPGAAPVELWRAVAVDAAASGGVAHVNLAFREPLWAPGAALPALASRPAPLRGAPRLDDAQVGALAGRLAGARRGLIHCGPHASADPAFGPAVLALGERLGWPVVTEFGSGARLGPPAAARVTRLDALARDEAFAPAWAPDLVLRFGRAPHSRAVQRAWRVADPQLIGVDPRGLRQDPQLMLGQTVTAEPVALLQGLLARLEGAPAAGWLAGWQALEARASAALDAAAAEGAWGGAAARALALGAPAGAFLHGASSLAFRDLDGWVPTGTRAARALVSRGANGIDGTLSAAVGHARVRPTALLTGDLAFLHDLSGLRLMGRTRPDLVVVVVDNDGGGIFDHLPLAGAPAARLERLFTTPQAADFKAICGSFGVPFADAPAPELAAAVAQAFAAGGPHVLRLAVGRAEDQARREAAWAAVATATRGVRP